MLTTVVLQSSILWLCFSPKSSCLSETTFIAFTTGQTSPQRRIHYSRRASWTTLSCVRRLVRPNLLWRRQRQHRWQRPLLISLRHGADVLPGGRREALQQDWAQGGADYALLSTLLPPLSVVSHAIQEGKERIMESEASSSSLVR